MPKRFCGRRFTMGVLLSLFLLAAGAGPAAAWWDGKWKFRKKIVLDTTPAGADVQEALADFTVLLRLHSVNFAFPNAKKDGTDIRFVGADDKTPLKFHVDRYEPEAEMALIWVKIPRLSPGSNQDFIWMYYGNSAAQAGQDPGGTYETNHAAVYHLGEKEGPPRDATAYGNHAKEFTGKHGTPAAVGTGVTLKGGADRIVIPGSPSMNFSKGFTFSAWVRPADFQGNARLFSWDDGKQSVAIGIEGKKLYCTLAPEKKKPSTEKTVDLPFKGWHHVAVAADPGKRLAIYLDGRERTAGKLADPLPNPAADIVLGGSAKEGRGFSGDLDEIHISSVARSPAWIHAAAAGQGPESLLLTYQEEEVSGKGGESLTLHLLSVVVRTITLDGWIVIGILAVMGAWSTIVFFDKLFSLHRRDRENADFSRSFRSSDLTALKDREEDFENSSLFSVYQAGMEEVERRLTSGEGTGGRKYLPPEAMSAIEASLDNASLQESRKSNAGVLILTLSISGGPFLGLFGTVWGVINTFAGVAEAGEANLAAIAPGVASALACTLAGLVVAIPALFAYSYLSGLIKNGIADMNAFMGQLMTRVEEAYGARHAQKSV